MRHRPGIERGEGPPAPRGIRGWFRPSPVLGAEGELLPPVPPALKPHRCPRRATVALGGTGCCGSEGHTGALLLLLSSRKACGALDVCLGLALLGCSCQPAPQVWGLCPLPTAVISRGVQGPCRAPGAAVVPALPAPPRGHNWLFHSQPSRGAVWKMNGKGNWLF